LACSGSEFIFWNLWIYWTVGRTPWTGDQPDARPVPIQRITQHRKTPTRIPASSGIRTHDPSVRAAEDSAWLGPLGQWNRTCETLTASKPRRPRLESSSPWKFQISQYKCILDSMDQYKYTL
jgi:hypothetical protein